MTYEGKESGKVYIYYIYIYKKLSHCAVHLKSANLLDLIQVNQPNLK